MSKEIERITNDVSAKKSAKGSYIRAGKKKVKKTIEESTENHGASKRLKVSVETTTEAFEGYIPSADFSAVTDSDSILSFIKEQQNKNKEPDIEDAEFEDVSQDHISSESYSEENKNVLPDETSLKEENPLEKAYEEHKKSPFRRAKELLDREVPNIERRRKTAEYRLVSEVVKDEGNYTREYIADSIFNKTIDFKKFANPDEFARSINLRDKTLIECIVEYVKIRSPKFPSVKERYQILISYIMMIEEQWEITLMPVVIGNMFWTQFESFLYNNNLAPRTVANICLELRAVIKWASQYGAYLSVDFDDAEFFQVDCKPKITLSEDEISRIKWFDLRTVKCREDHRKTLEIVRDHFILSCYVGQRFSDTVRIDETNFLGASEEMFRIIQQKTGNKAVLDFTRIYPEYPKHVRTILEKYKYRSPYKGDICNYNRWLHELARLVGLDDEVKYEYKVNGKIVTKTYKKWELISSHTARRTFITLAVKRGINSQYIKRASGHKSDSSFDKYIILNDENK